MEYIKGIVEREKSGYEEFLEKEEGDTACLEGAVHSLRDMGGDRVCDPPEPGGASSGCLGGRCLQGGSEGVFMKATVSG